MNEHSFTKAVLDKVPPHVHRQSMTGAALANNGTPDRYLDYELDLWVEFKWHPNFPRFLRPAEMLSGLQHRWLKRRHKAGRNAVVVIGFPKDGKNVGVILDDPSYWERELPRSWLSEAARSIPGIADYLHTRTCIL